MKTPPGPGPGAGLVPGPAPHRLRVHAGAQLRLRDPHTQFYDESAITSTLGAENYQGLVSALLHLVEEGEGDRGDPAVPVQQRHRLRRQRRGSGLPEATREDPWGPTPWITSATTSSRPRPTMRWTSPSIGWRRSELSQVISVTASTAVAGELQDLLPHRPQKVIFRTVTSPPRTARRPSARRWRRPTMSRPSPCRPWRRSP